VIDKLTIRDISKFGMIILAIISFLIAVNSRYFLNNEDLHKENFVTLSMVKFITEICEEDTGDTGNNYLEHQCTDVRLPIYESTASGLILKKVSNEAYILSANHFCNSEEMNNSLIEIETENEIVISDFESKNYPSEVVYFDETYDLCLLRSHMDRQVDTIEFSDSPEIGDKIFTIASPLGISESGILLHFEGFFSGCERSGMCFYTIPATSGSSGSVVFDMRGRGIGIIQMTPIYFRSISLGVGSYEIIKFLENASKSLNINLI